MSTDSNKISQFWNELKRRSVLRSLAIYAGSAFVFLEAATIIFPRWGFPDWSIDLVLYLIILGAVITLVVAWIFDITPEGVQKTKPVDEVPESEKPKDSNAWKLATYISLVVIVALIIFNVVPFNKLARAGTIESLVVLPFDNFTGSDDFEYLVSGIHSSLITDMGQLGGLRVMCKTTANSFKDTDMSVTEIATELNVDAAVEGSISCVDEDSVCVQIRLISALGEEQQLWVQDYRVAKSQFLNFYNDVTKKISEEINVVLTPREESLLAERRTVDPEAYDEYLRSYQIWGDFRPERFDEAINYLNSAIEKDPDWASLYMGLANVHMMGAQWGIYEPSTTDSIVNENLNKALELDPDLPDAHFLNGWIAFVTEWDWVKAEREFLKALAINPNDAMSRIWYAHLLCVLQRNDEASPQAQLALDLDPLNPVLQILFSSTQFMINGCEADLTQLEKLLTDNPKNYGANITLNYVAFICGDYETVIMTEKLILQTLMGEQFNDNAYNEIEKVFEEKDYHAAYEKIVRIWEDQVNPQIITSMDLAIVYTKANQYDKVMDMIERGYEIRDHTMPYITTAYDFEPLYDNPRFIDIVDKMNLPLPDSK